MGNAGKELDRARAARNRARRRFDSRLVRARQDLAPGAITRRATAEIRDRAQETIDEAAAIADGNRTIVAGTIAALVLWLFRKPIISWIEDSLSNPPKTKDTNDD